MKKITLEKILMLLAVSMTLEAVQAAEGDYPSRIVTIVVPVAAGGGTDTFARLIAQSMQKTSGRNVLIENRSGGGSTIGTGLVARAAPDGYTLLYSASSIATQNSIYPGLTYNVERDFIPVARPVSIPFILVAHPSVPVRNLKQLISLAKTKPGHLSYGNSGAGSSSNLGMLMISQAAGIKMLSVNYRGAGPVQTAVTSGEISLALLIYPLARLQIENGKLRPIAVTSAKRSSMFPTVPTVPESGIADFEIIQWHGLFAPAKTPDAVIKWLHTEVMRIVRQPETKERFAAEGAEPVQESPEEFARMFRLEVKRMGGLIQGLALK